MKNLNSDTIQTITSVLVFSKCDVYNVFCNTWNFLIKLIIMSFIRTDSGICFRNSFTKKKIKNKKKPKKYGFEIALAGIIKEYCNL